MSYTTGDQEDTLKEYQGGEGIVRRWIKELDIVRQSKHQKAFEKNGEKIVKNYRNADALQVYNTSGSSPARVMFNILWSNVQVLKPTLYSRMPKVVVERTFKDADPIGRLASVIAERATHYQIESQQDRFNYAVKASVEDRLLPGRGTVWVRYDAEFDETTDENGEPIVDEAGNAIRAPKPNSEKGVVDPVHWLDYFESPARNPYEIRWKARRAFMTRAQLTKRFGKIANFVELDRCDGVKKDETLTKDEQNFLLQAEVFEIWDLDSKKVYWITEGLRTQPLDVKDDPLKLKDFFPCPEPLLATTTTDSRYPTADFKIYEKLAEELDYVTKRISSIVECVRMVGMSAASLDKEIRNMLKLSDGQLWPIENWQQFINEKGGLEKAINWFPFDQAVAALTPLMQYQQNITQQIHEITGIPDIVRGASDPTETLGAQQQKAHWTVVKVSEKQAEVQRFCREIISKIAEIIFEPGFFSDQTIALMCGVAQMPPEDQQNFPAALELLRSDRLRTFRVDIETDSTIAIDEDQDKAARMEYLGAINSLVSNIQQVSQFRPELMQPMIESALFAARSFRTGRPVEGSWERAMKLIEDNDKAAAENPPQPPPDPAMAQVEINGQEVQMKGQEAQMKMQLDQAKLDLESQKLQLDGQKAQMDFEIESQKIQLQASQVMSKQQMDELTHQLDVFKEQFNQAVSAQELELLKFKTVLDQKDQALEEQRLQREAQMQAIDKLHNHISTVTEHVTALREKADKDDDGGRGAKSSREGAPSIPAIHIHNSGGSKSVTMRRLADGTLEGRTSHVEDGE